MTLKTARAYAAAAVLPNGELWITGGMGRHGALDSIEILVVKNNTWFIRRGPKMPRALSGHCFSYVNGNEWIVGGGYSPEEDGYSRLVDIFDQRQQKWYSKPWMPLENVGRIDSSCLNVLLGGQRRVMMSGGWSNAGMDVTEYYDQVSQAWKTVEWQLSPKILAPSLPQKVRSAKLVEIGGNAYLLGGVKCNG